MSKLKKRIKKCGKKQIEVARLAKIKYKTVNHLCSTGIHTVRLAKIYAPLLKCSPLDLIEL